MSKYEKNDGITSNHCGDAADRHQVRVCTHRRIHIKGAQSFYDVQRGTGLTSGSTQIHSVKGRAAKQAVHDRDL